MAYKNNSSKVWNGILTILLVLVLVGTAALVGFLSDGFKDWSKFKPDDKQTEETADNGGAIIGDSTGNGVSVKSVKIPKPEYAANGISPLAETAYTLTATVTPANATNSKVDWAGAFIDASSSWAAGKNFSDYVTVTPESDGSLKATVTCLQAFGEPISVTVTSRDNPEVSASCRVDYKKRVTGCDVTITQNGTEVTALDVSNDGKEYLFTPAVKYSVGTVDRTGVKVYLSLARSNTFYNYLISNKYFTAQNMQSGNPIQFVEDTLSFTTSIEKMVELYTKLSSTSYTNQNKMRNALIAYTGNAFSCSVFVSDDTLEEGSSDYLFTDTFEIGLGNKDLAVGVLEIELDNSSIIF
mgnify:CR=1 FL=1